jgi:dolichyl-phosphate-mannose-protein mannosyltransferase
MAVPGENAGWPPAAELPANRGWLRLGGASFEQDTSGRATLTMAEARAGAATPQVREASSATSPADSAIKVPAILVVLAAGLVLRLLLATFPGFGIDVGTFQAWSHQLAATGPWNFYETDFFTDYAPGYLYVLWFIGELKELLADLGIVTLTNKQFEYVLKLPSIIADVASAYLLYRLLDTQRMEVRIASALAYLLFPATLFIGAVWGQVDSLLAFFLLLAVYFLGRGRPIPAGVAYVIGFMVKPQAIAALPFFAFWALRNYPPRVWAEVVGVSAVVALALTIPFFPDKPWGLYDQLRFSADVYPYASFHAYNFWGVFRYIQPDDVEFIGLNYQIWGIVLYSITTLFIIYSLRDEQGVGALALGTGLCVVAFFMFVTRMHERYLFPAFLPLLAACVIYDSRYLWIGFAMLTVVQTVNLYHAYAEFNDNHLRIDWIYDWLQDPNWFGFKVVEVDTTVEWLSVLTVATLLPLLVAAYSIGSRDRYGESR